MLIRGVKVLVLVLRGADFAFLRFFRIGKMDKKYDEYLCIELIYISLFIIIIDMVKKMLFLYFF